MVTSNVTMQKLEGSGSGSRIFLPHHKILAASHALTLKVSLVVVVVVKGPGLIAKHFSSYGNMFCFFFFFWFLSRSKGAYLIHPIGRSNMEYKLRIRHTYQYIINIILLPPLLLFYPFFQEKENGICVPINSNVHIIRLIEIYGQNKRKKKQ
jgi:hypothetical protein